MKPVVKTIHFIGSKGLYYQQFQQFLQDIQAEYRDVLYHNDVRCSDFSLSGEEIGQFLATKGQPMSDPVWLADLAFLVDIKHLNVLNCSLQGQDAAVSQLYAHIKAFVTKLDLF